MRERGFGGIYAVGKGSRHPPVFACFTYTPDGGSKTGGYALVGKGQTCDTRLNLCLGFNAAFMSQHIVLVAGIVFDSGGLSVSVVYSSRRTF